MFSEGVPDAVNGGGAADFLVPFTHAALRENIKSGVSVFPAGKRETPHLRCMPFSFILL